MALDMQERHAFEHEEGRSPVWIGMAWGAVSLLGGAALLAAMLTFDVREIGWSYLNGSGLVIPGTSNVLGTAGLYGAGIFYWMLGAMAWMLVILLEWWGLYRLLHHGRLPRSVVYGGLFLLLFGCLFLTAGHVPGNEWVARHQIQGAGGWRAICWELVCFFRWPGDPLCWLFPGWAICWPWFMQSGCVPVRFAGPCCGNGVPGV